MNEKLRRQISELHDSLSAYLADTDPSDATYCSIEDEAIALEKALDDTLGVMDMDFIPEDEVAEITMQAELSSPFFTGRV